MMDKKQSLNKAQAKIIRYIDVIRMFNDFADYLRKGSKGSCQFKRDLEMDGQKLPGFEFDTNYHQIGLSRILNALNIRFTTSYDSIKSEKGKIIVAPEFAELMLDLADRCGIDRFYENTPVVDIEKIEEDVAYKAQLQKLLEPIR